MSCHVHLHWQERFVSCTLPYRLGWKSSQLNLIRPPLISHFHYPQDTPHWRPMLEAHLSHPCEFIAKKKKNHVVLGWSRRGGLYWEFLFTVMYRNTPPTVSLGILNGFFFFFFHFVATEKRTGNVDITSKSDEKRLGMANYATAVKKRKSWRTTSSKPPKR